MTVFFVLSGYLITSKLIEGPIDLRRFYIRRFFRLMPAAWAYMAFLFLLRSITRVPFISIASVRANLLCYRNFLPKIPYDLSGHFWSLSLEEQFYLVWPSILLFAGLRRSKFIALFFAVVCAGYRWVFWAHYDFNVVDGQSQVRADAPLVGCLLALLMADPRVRAAIARSAGFIVIPAGVLCLWAIARCHWLPPLSECGALAFLIAATVVSPGTFWSKLFAFRPLAYIGALSYSIYIWQEMFMPVRSIIALVVFMPLFVLGSYYLIEQPCRNFGSRLTARPYSGSTVSTTGSSEIILEPAGEG